MAPSVRPGRIRVGSIYRKLGVHSRVELARRFTPETDAGRG